MHTITRTAVTLHALNTSAVRVAWQPRTGAIRIHMQFSLKMFCSMYTYACSEVYSVYAAQGAWRSVS